MPALFAATEGIGTLGGAGLNIICCGETGVTTVGCHAGFPLKWLESK